MKKTVFIAVIISFIFTYFVFSFCTWNLNPLPSADLDFRAGFICFWIVSFVLSPIVFLLFSFKEKE